MSQQEVFIDPFHSLKPEKVWLYLTNICDEGKFKVVLEVNGQDKVLFNSYVEQSEGVVSNHYNLTWLIQNALAPNQELIEAARLIAIYMQHAKPIGQRQLVVEFPDFEIERLNSILSTLSRPGAEGA